MQALEQQLRQRFPHWFRGRRATLARPLLRTIGRWSRFDEVADFLQANGHLRDFDFVQAALEHLQVRHEADPAELRRIPATGRLLIVANHPSGALDALALLQQVGRVRRDVKIIANDLLASLDGLGGLLLAVRILGGRPGAESLRAVDQALHAEQCVIVFPAGEVARLGLRGVTDGRWRRGFLRFARATGAPVLPIRVEARNSVLFYGASVLFKPAGTALLAREMFARRERRIVLRIGRPLQVPAAGDPAHHLREVRRVLHAIGTPRERASEPGPEPLIDAVPVAKVRAGIHAMPLLGHTTDGREIRCGRLLTGSPVLREIGTEQEQAAETLGANGRQTFWRVTLPAIRWGVAYGVVLCTARVLGEFGAVSVVSGNISGETQTLPLFVEKNYENFNLPGAFGAAVLLALLALVVLMAMNLLKRKEAA